MDVLADRGDKLFVRSTLEPARSFVSPFSGIPFACLLWDHDGLSSAETRTFVSKQLLQAGCRYAVCGGENCKDWHDTFDDVWLESWPEALKGTDRDAELVTTWHEGESPEEVAFFLVRAVQGEEVDFSRYLVLHAGTGANVGVVDRWVREYALTESASD